MPELVTFHRPAGMTDAEWMVAKAEIDAEVLRMQEAEDAAYDKLTKEGRIKGPDY